MSSALQDRDRDRDKEDPECQFYATTTPGLEHVCELELRKFPPVHNIQCITAGGLTFTSSPFLDFSLIKSICSLNALVGTMLTSQIDDSVTVLERFKEYPLLENELWSKACHLKYYFDKKHGTPPSDDTDTPDDDGLFLWRSWSEGDENTLGNVFRVSCTRKKEEHFPRHKFTSLQAAGHLGCGIGKRYPKWKVDLTQADVDIIFHIRNDKGVIAINLIKEKTIAQRNRAAPLFDWITALAPPTAYSLCALLEAHLSPGMVICDPMCGIGTIPIEGALAFPHCFFIGADLSTDSVRQARANEKWTRDNIIRSSSSAPSSFNVEIVQWNAGAIFVKSESIDVIICDMPFGMKHGNYRQNRKLYPEFFREMLRILSDDGKASIILATDAIRNVIRATAAKFSCCHRITLPSTGVAVNDRDEISSQNSSGGSRRRSTSSSSGSPQALFVRAHKPPGYDRRLPHKNIRYS